MNNEYKVKAIWVQKTIAIPPKIYKAGLQVVQKTGWVTQSDFGVPAKMLVKICVVSTYKHKFHCPSSCTQICIK